MSVPKRLLICYAHPDDESFGLGALIARYVAQGVEVYLICATSGEAGSMDKSYIEQYGSIQAARLAELTCAVERLGIHDLFLLGYRDSGMMNHVDNTHPQCLWYQWNHDSESVVRSFVRVMRQVQPQVIITFNEYGGYGHPDHIACHHATIAALEHVNDPTYHIDDLPPCLPQKLYYSTVAQTPMQIRIWQERLKGVDPSKAGRNHDVDLLAILDHMTEITTHITITEYLQAWDDASNCHASQGGARIFLGFPLWLRRLLFRYQGFTRVIPSWQPHETIETDLFSGL